MSQTKTPISDQVREMFTHHAARIDAWGADMKADIGGARDRLRLSLRADLRSLRDEMIARLDRMEEELREAIAAVRASRKKGE